MYSLYHNLAVFWELDKKENLRLAISMFQTTCDVLNGAQDILSHPSDSCVIP